MRVVLYMNKRRENKIRVEYPRSIHFSTKAIVRVILNNEPATYKNFALTSIQITSAYRQTLVEHGSLKSFFFTNLTKNGAFIL